VNPRRGRGTDNVPDEPADAGNDGADRSNDDHAIKVRLDNVLADRGMTLAELARRVGVTVVNLSVLKNDRARAVRFSTLSAICRELNCQPGDLLIYEP
jgi:putative transcriptional regulator